MEKLTKAEATRRVRDLQDILDACYQAAGVIVSARFHDGVDRGWSGEGSIKAVNHYMSRLDGILKDLGRSHARTLLARELFIAVVRGDLTIQDVKEGSETNAQTQDGA